MQGNKTRIMADTPTPASPKERIPDDSQIEKQTNPRGWWSRIGQGMIRGLGQLGGRKSGKGQC